MALFSMKGSSGVLRLILLATMALLVAVGAVRAQNAGARIVGNVGDARGATVPAAKVIVVNVATQVHYDTTTNKDGHFQALDLPIGTYNVTVQADGFRSLAYENQVLLINQVLRLDAKLGRQSGGNHRGQGSGGGG